jgi:hypothetical protein
MTVSRKPRTKQAPGPAPAAELELTYPDNDDVLVPPVVPGGPDRCPTCGRPYFGPASSGLLDLVILTHEQLGHIKAVLETVVQP